MSRYRGPVVGTWRGGGPLPVTLRDRGEFVSLGDLFVGDCEICIGTGQLSL